MTSLATGHSPGSRQGRKSVHPPIFTIKLSMASQSWPVAETELCFLQTVTLQRGTTFPMYLFLLATILVPLAVLLGQSRTLGGYSLGNLKSNVLNTFDFTAVVMWFLVAGVG